MWGPQGSDRTQEHSIVLGGGGGSAINTNVLYVIASNEAVTNGSNGANDNVRSTSPISHVGIRDGFGGLLLWKTLHSLLSIPNCAGVKICLGASADKIAALYA